MQGQNEAHDQRLPDLAMAARSQSRQRNLPGFMIEQGDLTLGQMDRTNDNVRLIEEGGHTFAGWEERWNRTPPSAAAAPLSLPLGIPAANMVHFAFMDPPTPDAAAHALGENIMLGSVVRDGQGSYVLSEVGRMMVKFPLPAQLAKAIVASPSFGCTQEVIILAAMLSTQVVFLRPRRPQLQLLLIIASHIWGDSRDGCGGAGGGTGCMYVSPNGDSPAPLPHDAVYTSSNCPLSAAAEKAHTGNRAVPVKLLTACLTDRRLFHGQATTKDWTGKQCLDRILRRAAQMSDQLLAAEHPSKRRRLTVSHICMTPVSLPDGTVVRQAWGSSRFGEGRCISLGHSVLEGEGQNIARVGCCPTTGGCICGQQPPCFKSGGQEQPGERVRPVAGPGPLHPWRNGGGEEMGSKRSADRTAGGPGGEVGRGKACRAV